MASATRKVTRLVGMLFFNSTSTLIAKAISVAIGMPQPIAPSPLVLMAKYNRAGNTMPPMAARIGRIATLMFESSPANTSLFISKPMIKKNMVISPSLIQ